MILNKYIDRELQMQCLNCGKSLQDLILEKKIHIHLCSECREEVLNKLVTQIMDEGECPHCKGNLKVRNPTGKCDHLYYPNHCTVCKAIYKAKRK